MNSSSVSPDSKIKVVHLLHTMDYGGVETIILNFLDGIDNDRFDVHMVCFANPGGTEHLFIEAAERAGVSVRTIPWHRGKPIPRSARALVRILRETQADIIHTHNIYADVVGLVAAKWVGIKTIDSQ